MIHMTVGTRRGWRRIERYAYIERPYEDVWGWVAAHLSALGAPLPGGGHAVELRIRPGGMEVSRPVRLRVGGLVAGENRARAALGWADATRPSLFPQLEARLEIVPVPNDAMPFTQIGIVARYRPPFGPLGAIGDRLVGAEVTEAALVTFLDELAEAVEEHTATPAPPSELHPVDVRPDRERAGIERVLLVVDGLNSRPGGAAGTVAALAALPGVVHVSLDPWSGLVAVDHDPLACRSEQMTEALEDQAATPATE